MVAQLSASDLSLIGSHNQPVETLTAYITYARSRIHPVLTESASTALISSYVAMRKLGEDSRTQERRITATTRQLESMIRLSEAHARMRFSEWVEEADVREAGRLIKEAIKESAVSDELGKELDHSKIGTWLMKMWVCGCNENRRILLLVKSIWI